MSHLSPRKTSTPGSTFVGLATSSSVAIMCAALITGALVAAYIGHISWPLFTLFAASTIAVTAFVNVRGLFLTVGLAPLLYVTTVIATGWFLTGNSEGPTTTLLLAVYPILESFPILAAVTAGSVLIAVVRIILLKRHNEVLIQREQEERAQIAQNNRRASIQTKRAHERTTSRVTVQELIERRNLN